MDETDKQRETQLNTSMRDLISVIVPVYNAENYIRRCTESLCSQSFRDLEIMLVNDGSQDSSGLICDRLAAEDERIKVIHQENSGVSAARNAGLAAAHGAYITFADSDDYLHPGLLERLYNLLRMSGADISSCEYTSNEADLSVKPDAAPITFGRDEAISDMLCNSNITYSVYCKLFARSTVNGLRFRTEYSHNEDLLFCYEAFLNSTKIVHTTEKMYFYRINPSSATRIAFSHKRMTAIDVQEEILRDIEVRFPASKLEKTARQQFLKVNIYTGMQMMEAGYTDKGDHRRIRRNIRKRLPALLMGNLALGYKMNGCLLAVAPFWLRYRAERN